MNVRCFRLTLERPLEHLLRRHVFATIELDDAPIVKRISIAWQNALGPQTRFRNRKIRARASCDFRYLRILVYQNSKLIPRFSKTAASKLPVRTFERQQSR